MPLVGFIAEDGSGHYSFEDTLARAGTDAFPYPYPLIKGIIDSTQNRGEYISATSIIHCLRAEYLKRREDYYLTIEQAYPMFRGTLFHGLMEANPAPYGKAEVKALRRYKGIEIGGTADSILVYKTDEGDESNYIIEDWKTTDSLPKYNTPYTSHQKQVNIYRWLFKLPVERTRLDVWYFSMKGVKRTTVKKLMTDEEVEAIMDDRLTKLRASFTTNIPLPYALVQEDEKWECEYCPMRQKCHDLAEMEREQTWRRRHGLVPNDEIDGIEAPLWPEVLEQVRVRIDAEFGNRDIPEPKTKRKRKDAND